MSGAEVITLVFRLINFSLLVGIVVYFFQRKMRGQVKRKIQEKELFWQNLHTNKQALVDQQHKLAMEIDWQRKYGNELLQKISVWSQAAKDQEQLISENMATNAEKIYKRNVEFYHQKEKQETLKEVVPVAFKQARESLEKEFSEQTTKEQFMQKVFSYMKKSVE